MLDVIDRALREDLGEGDLTTAAVVPEGARARARIEQKAAGVPAGLRVAEKVFERVDPELRWHAHAREGEWREGGLLAEVAGRAGTGPDQAATHSVAGLPLAATRNARTTTP